MHHPRLEELVRRRQRFPIEAYEFVRDAIGHAGGGDDRDVTGRQLLEAASDLARREFGLMAATVFRLWGVHRTDDVGEIVFDLVDARLIDKGAHDGREEFSGAFDLAEALSAPQPIEIPTDDGMGP